MTLLLCYKKKFPGQVHLLRGKQECKNISRIYGFYDECKARFATGPKGGVTWPVDLFHLSSCVNVFSCIHFDHSMCTSCALFGADELVSNHEVTVWKHFTELFDCLPLAAVIQKLGCQAVPFGSFGHARSGTMEFDENTCQKSRTYQDAVVSGNKFVRIRVYTISIHFRQLDIITIRQLFHTFLYSTKKPGRCRKLNWHTIEITCFVHGTAGPGPELVRSYDNPWCAYKLYNMRHVFVYFL